MSYSTGNRGYLPWITCITFCYLLFELSFNARLLDIIGNGASAATLDNMESWGRFLSGIAVAILIWGIVIMPRFRPAVAVLLMAITAVVCVKTVFTLEKNLVTHFVNISTGTQRKEAVEINMLVGGVRDNSASIDRLDLSPEIRTTPSGKQLMAVLPFFILSVKNVDIKIAKDLPDAVRNQLIKDGFTSQTVYNDVYLRFVNEMHTAYRSYAALEREHAAVPGYDQAGYERHLREIFGTVPDRTYPRFSSFFMVPHIQNKAREALSLGGSNVSIAPNLDYRTFHETLWTQIIETKADTEYHKIERPDEEYADGGPRESTGRQAMEALVAPPIALFFSIIGAFTHIFKSTNYLIRWKKPDVRWRKTKILCVLGLAATVIGYLPNKIVVMPLYHYMISSVATHYTYGNVMGWAITWLIKMQAVFYPINELVRKVVLMGYTFGT